MHDEPVHDHAHGDAHRGDQDARRLAVALALIVAFMAGEVVAGILAHSLALLSDAAHMLTDAGALALSLVVLRLAAQPARIWPETRPQRSSKSKVGVFLMLAS